MSVQTNNLLLGEGELFIKRVGLADSKYVRVGSLKGSVQFEETVTTTEAKPGDRLAPVRRDKTGEKCKLTATVADFKVAQLMMALGQSLSTSQLTLTSTLQVYEEIKMGATASVRTLGNAAKSLTSVIVESLDHSTRYVLGTAYTVSVVTHIKPKSAACANKTLWVSYPTADASATIIRVGDKLTLQQVSLKFTHKRANGKHITVHIPIATVTGGLTIPFHETDYTAYNITFEGLADPTLARGTSLYKVIFEA